MIYAQTRYENGYPLYFWIYATPPQRRYGGPILQLLLPVLEIKQRQQGRSEEQEKRDIEYDCDPKYDAKRQLTRFMSQPLLRQQRAWPAAH
jgi:hypothetical protein